MTAYPPRVLLAELQERTSAAGNRYVGGWLGKSRLIGFYADAEDRDGNPIRVLRLFAQDPGDRPERQAGGSHQPVQQRRPTASPEVRRQQRASKAAFDAQRRHDDAMMNLNDEIPD